ncbi:MAG: hypothetical protein ACYS9Y_14810 [Planctomycetota bacterium]
MKTRKKLRLKKLCYPFAVLAAALILLVLLLLHTPAGFEQPPPISDGKVSRYLTHELAPQFYNGAQRQQPFEMVITQTAVNDILARFQWPKQFNSISISTPQVFFIPDNIVLMKTASVAGINLVITVVAAPTLDEVGAVRMTFITRKIAKRIYKKRLTPEALEAGDIWSQLTAALLDTQPFDPVFTAEDKKVRAENIKITPAALTVNFSPAPD